MKATLKHETDLTTLYGEDFVLPAGTALDVWNGLVGNRRNFIAQCSDPLCWFVLDESEFEMSHQTEHVGS